MWEIDADLMYWFYKHFSFLLSMYFSFTLLSMIISYKFSCQILGTFIYNFTCENKNTLTSSFHVCISFISCICCIILSKALSINSTAGWKVSILVLFLMLMEMLWVFLSLASCWFWGFCLFPSELELCPVLLDSPGHFYHEMMLDLGTGFFPI